MDLILDNQFVAEGIYKMDVAYDGEVGVGQFFMLRAWDKDPLLSRPISVHNYENGVLTFLYQIVGKGTQLLSKLEKDDTVELQGPYG